MNKVTEQELLDSAKTSGGERVTLDAVHRAIVSAFYFTAAEGIDGAELHRRMNEATEPFEVNPDFHKQTYKPGYLGVLTICVLRLWNGYIVTGQSACADPKNFNEDIGRRLAKEHAVSQIWPLMGYELKSRMANDQRLLNGSPVEGVKDHTYIGTKAVNAYPMTRRHYNNLRDWELPKNENGDDPGYLVEYMDRVENPPHVPGFRGYVSWSPKEVFERSYRKVELAR